MTQPCPAGSARRGARLDRTTVPTDRPFVGAAVQAGLAP